MSSGASKHRILRLRQWPARSTVSLIRNLSESASWPSAPNHDGTDDLPHATEVRWYPSLLRLLSASDVAAVSVDARPRTLGVDAERLIIAGIVPLVDRCLRWMFPGSGGGSSGAPWERSRSSPKGEGSASVIWTGEDGVFWSNGMLDGTQATCGWSEDTPAKIGHLPCLNPSFSVVPAAMYRARARTL